MIDEVEYRIEDGPKVKKMNRTYFCNNKLDFSNLLMVVILVLLYFTGTTSLPFYNKLVFNGTKKIEGYGYPLVATWIQMFFVAILLLIWDVLRHYLCPTDGKNDSWIFGKGFLVKLKYLVLPGVFFAATISLTNMGIFKLKSVDTHVILASTEIFWVVIFAWIVQREKPTLIVILDVLLLIAGVTLISINLSEHVKINSEYFEALFYNLSSGLTSAMLIVSLRFGITRLRMKDENVTVLEMALFKMAISTILLFPFTFIFEMKGYSVLYDASPDMKWLIFAGVFITFLFQTSNVGLTSYSMATSVGIVAQCKILPQILIDIIIGNFHPTVLKIVGTTLAAISAIIYSIYRYRIYRKEEALYIQKEFYNSFEKISLN